MLHVGGITFFEPDDDGIDSRLRVHDENQVELKLHYAIDPTARRTRYQVEAYFFVPHTLGIDRHSYGRDSFYSDVQAYIRFKTPQHTLDELGRTSGELPLGCICDALHGGDRDELGKQMRMLACLVRGAIRDATDGLEQRATRLAEDPHGRAVLIADLQRAIERVESSVARILEGLRALRPEFMHAQRPALIRELFEYTDECLSLDCEISLTGLLAVLDRAPELSAALGNVRARLVERVLAEQSYRRQAGYVTVVDEGKPDGAYVYRRSMLKKFAGSVLYLELNKEREGRGITQLGAMVAAGAAMFVSTVLALLSGDLWGVNTFPFVIAVIFGYMLKDRMKEWIKLYVSARSTRWLSDYSGKIRDPLSGTIVGRCRESFSFVAKNNIPPAVWRRRHAAATSPLETENKREAVMRYVKQVSLAGRSIARRVERASDISDILRFDLSRFLVRMDDAKQRVRVYDAARDRVRRAKLPRHYHINVVLVLRADDRGVVQMERFRLVLDKHGLRELQVGPQRPSTTVAIQPARAPVLAPTRV